MLVYTIPNGRSREGAWIEINLSNYVGDVGVVAPVRERGLKSLPIDSDAGNYSRSREGAWIEIMSPVVIMDRYLCRSREGAWIEIVTSNCNSLIIWSLP